MSTFTDIRDAIRDTMQSIPTIGQVHDFERFSRDDKNFKLHYLSGPDGNKKILGWYIKRVSFKQSRFGMRYQVVTRWRIVGFMGLSDDDASEKQFDDLIEQLVAAFQADSNLGGKCQSLDNGSEAGLQLDDQGPLMFAGVLCHGARLTLYTTHNE